MLFHNIRFVCSLFFSQRRRPFPTTNIYTTITESSRFLLFVSSLCCSFPLFAAKMKIYNLQLYSSIASSGGECTNIAQQENKRQQSSREWMCPAMRSAAAPLLNSISSLTFVSPLSETNSIRTVGDCRPSRFARQALFAL